MNSDGGRDWGTGRAGSGAYPDPLRHWDGTQWLRWTGTAWIPEYNPWGARPVPAGAGSVSRARSRRGWIIAGTVAVLAAAGVVIGILATSGSDRQSTSGTGGHNSRRAVGIRSHQDACVAETNVILDVLVNNNLDQTGLEQAVGLQNDDLQLAEYPGLGTFEQYETQGGSTYAEKKIVPNLRRACSGAGNPILTRDQLNSLVNIATADDANLLRQVQVFDR